LDRHCGDRASNGTQNQRERQETSRRFLNYHHHGSRCKRREAQRHPREGAMKSNPKHPTVSREGSGVVDDIPYFFQ
jgi:hypothetical protein